MQRGEPVSRRILCPYKLPKVRVFIHSSVFLRDLKIRGAKTGIQRYNRGPDIIPALKETIVSWIVRENGLESRPSHWYKRTVHCDRKETDAPL